MVGEQAPLGHELLVGPVSQGRGAHGQHRGRGERVQEELRPTVRLADVYGTDQDPGHGAHEARDPGRGQRGVFGLYLGRHIVRVFRLQIQTQTNIRKHKLIRKHELIIIFGPSAVGRGD